MICMLLQGKTKPIYHPAGWATDHGITVALKCIIAVAVDMGDHLVITNTKEVVLTGKKWDGKLYRHHTG